MLTNRIAGSSPTQGGGDLGGDELDEYDVAGGEEMREVSNDDS